ncbi:alpha/beta hydrolase [Prosthecomicrobium sp. N25]|uniref:alpha/beta hydrolase n=1 Tax=Prosthecomicrobium sp. N25 TaxID=3129254 RepID=UPI0030774D42
MAHRGWRLVQIMIGLVALAAIAAALSQLRAANAGVTEASLTIGATPATVFRPEGARPGPVVLIAHGFAGSQTLMRSFALTFARNGYAAVTFDFAGHGRNPEPLTGSITDSDGATRALLAETSRVADYARILGDGRLAILGHSMASDIVVRFAQVAPDVQATIAVSMFSPAVTATSPRNLLVIVGDWEGGLKQEALRVLGLATAPAAAEAGRTYGDPAVGTGRRVAFSAHVEHASVLYSQESMREAVAWLDQTFAISRAQPPIVVGRGLWILLYLFGAVLLARQLSLLLPRLIASEAGAGLHWRQLWLPLLLPMIATPLLLRVFPTHFLPVLVADYLASHFAVYGLLTALCLRLTRCPRPVASSGSVSLPRFVAASAAVAGYGFIALVWPIDVFVTSFFPVPERIVLILAMLAGTIPYFLADEWLTRGEGAAAGGYAASKLAFVASLGIAISLDLQRLFFLVIIIPVIIVFFLVYGLFSRWTRHSTGHPFVAGLANAVAFAWAIGVTFPLLSR